MEVIELREVFAAAMLRDTQNDSITDTRQAQLQRERALNSGSIDG